MFRPILTRPSILPSPCTPLVSSGWPLFLFTLAPTTRLSPCASVSASVPRWLSAACLSQRYETDAFQRNTDEDFLFPFLNPIFLFLCHRPNRSFLKLIFTVRCTSCLPSLRKMSGALLQHQQLCACMWGMPRKLPSLANPRAAWPTYFDAVGPHRTTSGISGELYGYYYQFMLQYGQKNYVQFIKNLSYGVHRTPQNIQQRAIYFY